VPIDNNTVETCKLNQVNPRENFKNLVEDLLLGKNHYTSKESRDLRHSRRGSLMMCKVGPSQLHHKINISVMFFLN
jgi:hypothetical protein